MQCEADFIALLLDDKKRATEWARNHHLIADPASNPCSLIMMADGAP